MTNAFCTPLASLCINPNDKIIVVDHFEPVEPHGEWVSHVVAAQGIETTADQIGEAGLSDEVHSEAGFIHQFTTALQTIQHSGSTARVINISNSRSQARAVYELAPCLIKMDGSLEDLRAAHFTDAINEDQASQTLTEADRLITDLNLDADASREDILKAVVDKVANTFSAADMLAEESELGDTIQALHEQGVSVVISAGNHQQVADRLDDLDIDFDREVFCDNVLVKNGAISVGASDQSMNDFFAQGSPFLPSAAAVSNASGEVTLAADGTDIAIADGTTPVVASGTSFAAPAVSALLADLYAINPSLTPDEALQILADTAISGPDDVSRELGAGLIFPEAARLRARDPFGD